MLYELVRRNEGGSTASKRGDSAVAQVQLQFGGSGPHPRQAAVRRQRQLRQRHVGRGHGHVWHHIRQLAFAARTASNLESQKNYVLARLETLTAILIAPIHWY